MKELHLRLPVALEAKAQMLCGKDVSELCREQLFQSYKNKNRPVEEDVIESCKEKVI